jgi:four helix bundle protein
MSRLSEDLRNRTKQYASAVVRFYSALPRQRKEVEVLGNQLLRSGTSVAAHAREASRARSDAEFCSKLDGLLQEPDESSLWIELLRDDCGIRGDETDRLYRETSELIAIFVTIISKVKSRKDQRG